MPHLLKLPLSSGGMLIPGARASSDYLQGGQAAKPGNTQSFLAAAAGLAFMCDVQAAAVLERTPGATTFLPCVGTRRQNPGCMAILSAQDMR